MNSIHYLNKEQTMLKGIFTSNSGAAGEKIPSLNGWLVRNEFAGTAPIYAISSGAKNERITDTSRTWYSTPALNLVTKATGAVTAAATSFTVADAGVVLPGSILLVEKTKEYMIVTGVAGSVLTVTRGYGGSTAAAFTATDDVRVLGELVEEGSNAPTAQTRAVKANTNYTEIFRQKWDVSGTVQAVNWATGDKVATSKEECGLILSEKIESSLIWGIKGVATVNGSPARSMDGLLNMIKTNKQSATSLTDAVLDTFVSSVMEQNVSGMPNERIMFVGTDAFLELKNLVQDGNNRISYQGGQAGQAWGLNYNEVITPFGSVKVMIHPMFNKSATLRKSMLMYHPGLLNICELRPLQDENIINQGIDAIRGVKTTELTCEYLSENTAGLLTLTGTGA